MGKVNLCRASYSASIELTASGLRTEKGVCSCNHPLQHAWSVDSSPQSPPSGCLAFALRTWSLPLLNTPSSCCKGDYSVGTGFCFCFLAREWHLSFSALARSVAREVCIVPKWPSWLNLVCGAAENGDVMWLCLCVTSRHAGRDMTGVAAFWISF